MHTYIVLGNFTDQGRRMIAESPRRLDTARAVLAKLGGTLKDFNLTMGQHDFVATLEASDDELVARFLLAVESEGNVKTVTLRAFTEEEYRRIIKGPN
jgi:uncharacterized protein with GYD domain